jgi:molybdate transport repressor ModE-like protein
VAGTLDLSYRRAWGKIREIEQNLGVELVQSAAGGTGGGGSRLTPAGELLIERYDQFAIRSRDAVAAIYDEIFSPGSPTDPATLRSDRFGPR